MIIAVQGLGMRAPPEGADTIQESFATAQPLYCNGICALLVLSISDCHCDPLANIR